MERCVDRSTVKVVKPCVWSPPLNDNLFFNVDGSARGCPGMAGIGGVGDMIEFSLEEKK